MSWISKISLSVSVLSLITLILARIFMGGWAVFLWGPLVFFLGGLIVSLIFDFKSYWSVLTLRTAKNGMNLGLSLVVMVVILSSIAYLTSLWDKTFDLTEEKLHSLSPQTTQLLDSMKETSILLRVFYKGQNRSEVKRNLKDRFKIFTQYADHFKINFVDAYKNNKLANQYLSNLSDKDSLDIFVFLEYAGKKVRVSFPINEEKILSAMIRVSRRAEKNIYFTSGHRERDFSSKSTEGLESFRKALEESSFNLVEWNFIEEKTSLPESTQVLLIIGPSQPFFEQEIQWIEEYIDRKGKIFIALDPGQGHNLAPFIEKKLGIQFKDNFVGTLNLRNILRNETSVAGVRYSSDSPVTQSFEKHFKGSARSFFYEVSELAPSASAPSQWNLSNLVYSDPTSYVVKSLSVKPGRQKLQSRVIGMSVEEFAQNNKDKKEKLSKENLSKEKSKEGFSAVVFGDSDFLTNKAFHVGVNRDLALNTISYLADQGDLISLRPKKVKGTKVILTSSSRYILFIFGVFLPLLFSVLAGVSWLYRKKA